MDRPLMFAFNRSCFIDRFAEHVHDSAESRFADRDFNRGARIGYREPALQAVAGSHGNRTNHAVSHLLLDFQGESSLIDLECVIYFRNFRTWKFRVYNRSNNFDNFALCHDFLYFAVALYPVNLIQLILYRCCSTYDLRDFLCDGSLARFVVNQL